MRRQISNHIDELTNGLLPLWIDGISDPATRSRLMSMMYHKALTRQSDLIRLSIAKARI